MSLKSRAARCLQGSASMLFSLMLGRSSAQVHPLMSQSHRAPEGPRMPAGHVSRPQFDSFSSSRFKHRKGTDGRPSCMHHLDLPLWGSPKPRPVHALHLLTCEPCPAPLLRKRHPLHFVFYKCNSCISLMQGTSCCAVLCKKCSRPSAQIRTSTSGVCI